MGKFASGLKKKITVSDLAVLSPREVSMRKCTVRSLAGLVLSAMKTQSDGFLCIEISGSFYLLISIFSDVFSVFFSEEECLLGVIHPFCHRFLLLNETFVWLTCATLGFPLERKAGEVSLAWNHCLLSVLSVALNEGLRLSFGPTDYQESDGGMWFCGLTDLHLRPSPIVVHLLPFGL